MEDIKESIDNYIENSVCELKKEETVKLRSVYPNVLQEVLGDFSSFEMNGNDYWAKTNHYEISGNMFYGTAEITKL